MFVDRLAQLKPMSTPERRAVRSFLADAVDIDDVVERTVRLLAQLTRQVAIVQYPQYDLAKLVRVELVDLGPGRTLVIVISDDGQVEQRVIPDYGVEEDFNSLRDQINEICVGGSTNPAGPDLPFERDWSRRRTPIPHRRVPGCC